MDAKGVADVHGWWRFHAHHIHVLGVPPVRQEFREGKKLSYDAMKQALKETP